MSLSRPRSPEAPCRLALLALVLLYLATVLPSVDDDQIVGGDEGWVMSSAVKLAEDGVFGSDLFRGFYAAEDHYFFNLPLHHVVLAGAFKVIGVGVGQARLVSAAFGLVALLLTYALGRRLAGPLVGLGAAALLVLLRLNLAPFSGLTLTDLGATVRYDLVTVPYGLAAVLVIARRPEAPTPAAAATSGLLVGLAALTQFIGALFALPLALFLATTALPGTRRALLVGLLAVGVLLPFIPYGAYALSDWGDFRGQSRSVEQETNFLSPAFYWRQLRHEPERYGLATGLDDRPASLRDLARRPSARLALLVVGPLAAAHVLRRARREPFYRLLGLTLIALVLQLALFESTKRFVYWVVVAPFLCVAIADLALAVWSFPWKEAPRRLPGWLPRAAVALVLTLFAAEGLAVAARDLGDAVDAPDYAAFGRRLDAALPAGASALGDNRLWPALRARDFRSLHLLFYHTNPRISRDRATDVFGALERIDPDYILLSPLSRAMLADLSPRDAADFDRFLASRTELVGTVADAAYGPIEVYRVKR